MGTLVRFNDFQQRNPAAEYIGLLADRTTVTCGRGALKSSDPNHHDTFIRSAGMLASLLEARAESISGRAGSMSVGETTRMTELMHSASVKLFDLRTAVANMSFRIYQSRSPMGRAQATEEMLEATTALYNCIDSHHWLARRALWVGGVLKADPASLYFSKGFRILFKDMTKKSVVTAGIIALASGATWMLGV